MGDLATHKEIVLHMIPQLQQISAAENYTYVEFGNFLTDVSQFRDPVAFQGAKKRTKTGARGGPLSDLIDPVLCGELDGFLGSGNLNKWIDDIFGVATPEAKRHGALPMFLRHLCRAFAHIKFSAASTHHDTDLTPLSAAEVDRVFAAAFTQYFPHEHLDYPPLRAIRNADAAPKFQPGGRKLLRYLELHTAFISDELSKIEFEWVQNRALPATHPTRCDLLVRLGHILHAVEDFFFHSNVVEIRQWNRIVKANPGRQPETVPDDYRFLVDNILTGTGHDVTSIRLRRRLARRLRYPRFDYEFGERPDDVPTRLAVSFGYTGGFGSEDVSHTLSSGLEAMEESLRTDNPVLLALLQTWPPPLEPMPLVQVLFSETERRTMASGACSELNTRSATHRQQVTSGAYELVFAGLQASGDLTAESYQAFVDAFDLDRSIMTAYPGKPGPGGFLLVWLRIIQRKVDESHQKANTLDGDADSAYDYVLKNGASEETVGTHSLMAKDGDNKDPLRTHAMALAKCASAALAVILRQRIEDDPDPNRAIDWEPILRHFMRIPPGTANSWEEQVLTALNAGAALPTLSSLQDKPTIDISSSLRVRARRTGQNRSWGENSYRNLEGAIQQ